MSRELDFERRIRAWLDEEGPQDVPSRVVDAAIERAAATPRLRPLPKLIQSLVGGIESAARIDRAATARAWITIILLMTLLAASVVLAGAFLFQVDHFSRNGPIAYDAGGDIYIVSDEPGAVPRQLTKTLGIDERAPLWSPNGRYLAYWVTDVDHSEVHVYDRVEGGTKILREHGALLLPLNRAVFGWSPDSTRIAVPARGSSADGTQVGIETVIVYDIGSETVEQVPVDMPVWSFGWSPDGRFLGLVSESDLYVYDEKDAEVRPIRGRRAPGATGMPYWLSDIPPVFTSDSHAVIFTDLPGADGAYGDLWKFWIDEERDEPVLVAASNDLAPVVAGSGDLLAFGRSRAVTLAGALDGTSEHASDLIVMSTSGGAGTTVARDVWPQAVWSPDSQRLITKSLRSDELLIIDLARPDEPLRVSVPATVGGYSWGPRPP